MKKFITSNPFIYTLGIIFVFAIWFAISFTQGEGNLVFPNPIETLQKTGYLLTRKYIWDSIWATLRRTLLAFLISFLAAMVIGSIAGLFKKVYVFLKPIIIVLKSVPTAAFVFFFLVITNSTIAPVFIVILLSFPILYEAVVGGINSVPKEIKEAIKVDSGKFFRPLFKVKLPIALPYILVGLASSFALSIKTGIMAEIITGSTNAGLGSAINMYRSIDPTDLTPVFAIAFITIVIILFVDLIGYIIKRLLPKEE